MPPNVGSGRIEINQSADTGTSITIFEGAGQLAGGTPPFRVFDPSGNLVYSLGVAGGVASGAPALVIKTLTAGSYTMVAGDSTILANCAAGQVSVTLPPANISAPFSRQVLLIKTDATANSLNILRQGSDLILNATSINVFNEWGSVWLVSDGVSLWYPLPGAYAADVLNLNVVTGATYSINIKDYKILANATSNAIAISLPAANAVPAGFEVRIEKTDASANAVTVSRAGADTIEGATSVSLAAQYANTRLTSDGVGVWYKF